MMITEEERLKHPLILVSSSSTETDEDTCSLPQHNASQSTDLNRKKSQKNRRRGRGGRRRSSVATTAVTAAIDIPENNKEFLTAKEARQTGPSSAPVVPTMNDFDNTSTTPTTSISAPRRRRRRSSAAVKPVEHRKTHNASDADIESEQDSSAFHSIVDIISEMKRLPLKPFIVEKKESDDGNSQNTTDANEQKPIYYKRTRRFSEPPHKSAVQPTHFDLKKTRPALSTIQESKKTKNDKSPTPSFSSKSISRPIFNNSFMVLEEVEDEQVADDLVYPLSTTSIPKIEGNSHPSVKMPTRSRSKSVPDAIYHPTGDSSPLNHHHHQNSSSNPKGRKIVYPVHLGPSEAYKLVRAHKLYSGILKVNAKDSSEANVECEELGASIYIFGSRNRNRALNGDEVAVELVDVDDMLYEKHFKRQVRQTRRLSVAANNSSSNASSPMNTPSAPLSSISEDNNPFFANAIHENDNDSKSLVKRRPQYCGRVVSILERPKFWNASGILSLNRPYAAQLDNSSRDKKDANPKIVWFIPTDKRLPLVAIPLKEAPPDFIKYHEEYKNRTFMCNIKRWPATSLHPFGTIVKEIGWMGELPVHCGALIADHHLKDTEYPKEVLEALSTIPPGIRKDDRKGRRDLTIEDGMHIFTCDMGTNNDDNRVIQHAFSIKVTEDNIYEVGIHISDIARFVPVNSVLDRELRTRGCAVNLTEKMVPLFPSFFLQSHCALVPNREQLAYSVICRFTHNGSFLHTWMGRTIIRPTDHFSFEQLHTSSPGEQLLALCQKLQQNRIQKMSGLSLAAMDVSVQFHLSDSGYPDDARKVCKDDKDEELLLRELLLVANMEVAQKICSKFPDQALLYRQAEPSLSSLTLIQDYFDNVPLTSSLQGLFQLVQEAETSSEKQEALLYLMRQCVPDGQYYSAGAVDISKFCHSTYGASIYTVFTDPFYNYASIQVQRQLTMSLHSMGTASEEQRFMKSTNDDDEDDEEIVKVARRCNFAQTLQRAAEQASRELYTAAFIYRQCLDKGVKWLSMEAIVVGLDSHHVDVYIPKYDLAFPVHLSKTDALVTNNSGWAGGVHSYADGSKEEQRYEYEYDSMLNVMRIMTHGDKDKEEKAILSLKFLSLVQVYVHVDLKAIKPLLTVRFFQPEEESA